MNASLVLNTYMWLSSLSKSVYGFKHKIFSISKPLLQYLLVLNTMFDPEFILFSKHLPFFNLQNTLTHEKLLEFTVEEKYSWPVYSCLPSPCPIIRTIHSHCSWIGTSTREIQRCKMKKTKKTQQLRNVP